MRSTLFCSPRWWVLTVTCLTIAICLTNEQPVHAQDLSSPTSRPSVYQVYLPVITTPAPLPPSEQLIIAAFERGEINFETALIYKVFALFGDQRLPASYRGDDSQVEDSRVLLEVTTHFSELSSQTQSTLQPFLLRPTSPGSWIEQGIATVSTQHSPTSLSITWGVVNTVNGKIKVWYQHRYVGDASKADDIALALDAIIWPDLIDNLKMKAPLSDQGYPDNGGDGRLDIYLVHIGNRGATRPIDGCEQTPAYIKVNSDRPIGDATHEGILQTVVHELMHASQFAYPVKDACSEYDWWAEASAKWAEDYVYPLANSEQPYLPPFIKSVELPLENSSDSRRPYGAYLWPFYLTHRHQNELIPAIWKQTAEADSLEAINRSIPGGFEQQWPEFTRRNWNQPPVTDYQTWDKLTQHVEGAAVQTIDVNLQGVLDKKIVLDIAQGIQHLSAVYFHLHITDPNARTLAFYNGYTYKVTEQDVDQLLGWSPPLAGIQLVAEPLLPEERTGATVQALVKIAGQEWRLDNWTDKPFVSYCRDRAAERVEEMVLIFSNSLYKPRNDASKRSPVALNPTLWVTDLGCWQWQGELNLDSTVDGVHQTDTAQVIWMRDNTQVTGSALSNDIFWAGWINYRPKGTYRFTFTGAYNHPPHCQFEVDVTTSILEEPSSDYLSIRNYTTSGSLYRAYVLQGFETTPFTYTSSCGTTTTGSGDFRVFYAPKAPWDVVQFGGLIEFSGPDQQNTGTQHWQLLPQPDP